MRALHRSLDSRRTSTLLAVVALVAGCQAFLRDVEVDSEAQTVVGREQPGGTEAGDLSGVGQPGGAPVGIPEGNPSVGGLDGSLGSESCIPGTTRCNGRNLQACLLSGAEQVARWQPQQDCQVPELCIDADVDYCAQRVCSPGEVSCAGAVPRTCNETLSGWVEQPACQSEAHCSTDNANCPMGAPCCLEAPCEAGQWRCSDGALQQCNDARTAWESQSQCASDDLCQGGLVACSGEGSNCACAEPTCEVGETRCNGATLEVCNAGLSGWDVVDECASAALCQSGRLGDPALCTPQACEVGEANCTTDGKLQFCLDDQTDFAESQDCEGPQFCNSVGGVCESIPCEAGEQRCNGATIQQCVPERTGFEDLDVCATPQLCNDSNPSSIRCDPPRCGVNQFQCFGNQPMRCNAGRTDYNLAGPPCLRAELCSEERQRCDFCFPSRRECTPEQDASRTCNVSGNFFGQETFCPLGCIPDTGACRTCQVGTFRCQGNNLEICNDGLSFSSLNQNAICDGPSRRISCVNGQPRVDNCANGCNFFGNQCNECSGQQRRCAGQQGFQQCQGGFFGATQSCGEGLTCGGPGVCSCTPGDLRCLGSDLVECNGRGDGLVLAAQCSGTVLRSCAGGGAPVLQACESAAACQGAVDGECLVLEPPEEPEEDED